MNIHRVINFKRHKMHRILDIFIVVPSRINHYNGFCSQALPVWWKIYIRGVAKSEKHIYKNFKQLIFCNKKRQYRKNTTIIYAYFFVCNVLTLSCIQGSVKTILSIIKYRDKIHLYSNHNLSVVFFGSIILYPFLLIFWDHPWEPDNLVIFIYSFF